MSKETAFRFTIDLPLEEHKRLKTMAAIYGKTMRDIIIEALDKFYIEENKIPNEETRKVLDEIKRGEGLIKNDSIEDFFNKLGI